MKIGGYNVGGNIMSFMFIGVCFIIFGAIASCLPSSFEPMVRQTDEEKIEPTSTPELGVLESGIFFEVHVPRRVKIENIWQGYVDGNLTRIYAGQLLLDYRVSTSFVLIRVGLGRDR